MSYLLNIVFLVALYRFSGVFSLPATDCNNCNKSVVVYRRFFQTSGADLSKDISKFIGQISTELNLNNFNTQFIKDLPQGVTINTKSNYPVRVSTFVVPVNKAQTYQARAPTVQATTVQQSKPQPPREPIRTTIFKQSTHSVVHDHRYDKNPFLQKASSPSVPIPAKPAPPAATAEPDFRIQTAQPQDLSAVCGREAATLTPFIHGGTVMPRGQFPWLSAIYKKFSQNLSFICGGSLLSRRTVLSAAHCFMKLSRDNIVVYLGRYNLDNYNENGYVTRGIDNLMLHPQFNVELPYFPDADIAILHLDAAVDYTPYVTPICLWSGDDRLERIAGTFGTVAGWGVKDSTNKVSSLPQKVNIKIVTESECLRNSDLFRKLGTSRTFCAGNGDDSGPCLGDSGSGFMIQRNGVWMLRGIVSAGRTVQGTRTCNLEEYVIYSDVAKHMQWVKTNMV